VLDLDAGDQHTIGAEVVAAAAGIPLDVPSGIAVRDGTVLVANTSAVRNTPEHWAVLEIGTALR